jgi:hypothetical protein
MEHHVDTVVDRMMYLNRKYLENELSKYNASQIIEKKNFPLFQQIGELFFQFL